MSVSFSYFIVLFRSSIFLLIFYLFILIIENGALKSLLLLNYPLDSVNFWSVYFEILLGEYMFIMIVLLIDWPFYHYKILLFDFSNKFCLKVYFTWYYRYSGEGNGTPLQYSCLENPTDRGAWWAAVHGFAESRTLLNNFTFTFHFHALEKEMATHSSILA